MYNQEQLTKLRLIQLFQHVLVYLYACENSKEEILGFLKYKLVVIFTSREFNLLLKVYIKFPLICYYKL